MRTRYNRKPKVLRFRRKRRASKTPYSRTRRGTVALSNSQITNIRGQSPLSNKFVFKTRYVETYVSLAPGAAGIAGQRFYRANSIFDPSATGVGHQPIGFDQLMIMYDHFTVIGSKIKVSLANTDGVHQSIVGITLTDDQTASGDLSTLIENGNTTHRLLAPNNGDEKSIGILTKGFSADKFFGHKVMQDKQYSGDITANPTEQAYFMVWAAPMSQVDADDVKLLVQIEYTAILTEPKELAQS